jgi:lipoic acid synthetase
MAGQAARPQRLPSWLRVKLPSGEGSEGYAATRGLLTDLHLHTVCQSAKCPNIFECFSKRVATFLVLGHVCTRNCAFCNITPGRTEPLDPGEPARVAEAAARLGTRS